MASINEGDYRIYFYDKYGTKQTKGVPKAVAKGLGQAIKKARRYAKLAGFPSYRVDRIIYNSLDHPTERLW